MAQMRQGGTGDNLPRPIVGGRRTVCHSPSRGRRLVLAGWRGARRRAEAVKAPAAPNISQASHLMRCCWMGT